MPKRSKYGPDPTKAKESQSPHNPHKQKKVRVDPGPEFGPGEQPFTPPPFSPSFSNHLPTGISETDSDSDLDTDTDMDKDSNSDTTPSPEEVEEKMSAEKLRRVKKIKAFTFSKEHQMLSSRYQKFDPRLHQAKTPKVSAVVHGSEIPAFTPHAQANAERNAAEEESFRIKGLVKSKDKKPSPKDV